MGVCETTLSTSTLVQSTTCTKYSTSSVDLYYRHGESTQYYVLECTRHCVRGVEYHLYFVLVLVRIASVGRPILQRFYRLQPSAWAMRTSSSWSLVSYTSNDWNISFRQVFLYKLENLYLIISSNIVLSVNN